MAIVLPNRSELLIFFFFLHSDVCVDIEKSAGQISMAFINQCLFCSRCCKIGTHWPFWSGSYNSTRASACSSVLVGSAGGAHRRDFRCRFVARPAPRFGQANPVFSRFFSLSQILTNFGLAVCRALEAADVMFIDENGGAGPGVRTRRRPAS